jgi:hypothetical protein
LDTDSEDWLPSHGSDQDEMQRNDTQ